MRDPFGRFVARRGVVLLDGGHATELERLGVDLSDPLWSARALLDAPDSILRVHRAYLEAGADVIASATYQATIPGILARGLTQEQAEAVLRSGVDLARRARDAFFSALGDPGDRPVSLVAASIGSYGAFLANGAEYRGEYGLSTDALAAWHRPRVRLLEESGADVMAFETVPSAAEARAIVRVLGEADGPPAWLSFSARSAAAISDGTAVEDAVAIAGTAPRLLAVGFNCVTPELVLPLLARARGATSKRLVVYPNRGDTWDAVARGWIVRGVPVDFRALAPAWRDAGATLIGGCCRTTPDDVRAMASGLESGHS